MTVEEAALRRSLIGLGLIVAMYGATDTHYEVRRRLLLMLEQERKGH